MMQSSDIPLDHSLLTISDDKLEEMLYRIKPLVLQGDCLYHIKKCDPRRYAFTWSKEITTPVNLSDWNEIFCNETFHSCAYYGFFKPSIAECLAQNPVDPFANAFWIDTETVKITRDGDGHIATTHWGRI